MTIKQLIDQQQAKQLQERLFCEAQNLLFNAEQQLRKVERRIAQLESYEPLKKDVFINDLKCKQDEKWENECDIRVYQSDIKILENLEDCTLEEIYNTTLDGEGYSICK